jgi:hypothetical protein
VGLSTLLNPFKRRKKNDDAIDLSYHNDEPLPAMDAAHADDSDPLPSEEAVIPPPPEPAPVAEEPIIEPEPELAPVPEIKKDIIVRLPSALKPIQFSPPSPPKELGDDHLPFERRAVDR